MMHNVRVEAHLLFSVPIGGLPLSSFMDLSQLTVGSFMALSWSLSLKTSFVNHLIDLVELALYKSSVNEFFHTEIISSKR